MDKVEADVSTAQIIQASYDRMRQWVMDPIGYFLIRIHEGKIEAGFCKKRNKVEKLIVGKTAIEVYNTIVREGLISSLQHAADLGAELTKAEIAMKLGVNYIQDSELLFPDKA